MLKLYNTLTQKEEEFKPIVKGKVGMYVCGPTVNGVPHLGHAKQQITFDVLRKTLIYNGFKVKFVSNITDVDDKIINKANELGKDIIEFTKENLKMHIEDYSSLNVSKPDIQPKASEYINQMIALIQKLDKKGFTYVIENDGVYYNTSKFKKYGKLSHQKIEDLKSGARVKTKDLKKNKEDFALWKFSKPGEPQWKSPWGNGRPGWHIECSAMSESILGVPFDIHGGGHDLIFPHHEDEIAQTEAAYGTQMAKYWIHNGMVNVENVKMSKSLGNFTTIRDLFEKYDPEVIRYFVMLTHYRSPTDFSAERIDAAKTAFERIKRKIIEIKKEHVKGNDKTKEYDKEFLEAINNDLNTPRAIQILHKVIDDFDFDSKKKIKLIERFDSVLGLSINNMKEEKQIIPKEIKKMAEDRDKMRREKKWAESDILRNRMKELGYNVLDTPEGFKIEKI